MNQVDIVVSIPGDEAVDERADAHRKGTCGQGWLEGQQKRKRTHGLWRDSRERPALANRLPCTTDVERLQIAEAPVDRSKMVEGCTAAEVIAFDERHRQASLRRVVRDRQTVDAA